MRTTARCRRNCRRFKRPSDAKHEELVATNKIRAAITDLAPEGPGHQAAATGRMDVARVSGRLLRSAAWAWPLKVAWPGRRPRRTISLAADALLCAPWCILLGIGIGALADAGAAAYALRRRSKASPGSPAPFARTATAATGGTRAARHGSRNRRSGASAEGRRRRHLVIPAYHLAGGASAGTGPSPAPPGPGSSRAVKSPQPQSE